MPKDTRTINAPRSCPTCSGANDASIAIDNEDLLLTLQFHGADALSQATTKCSEIENRFTEAKTELLEQGDTISLEVAFSCGAEKILFLMAERSRLRGDAPGSSA